MRLVAAFALCLASRADAQRFTGRWITDDGETARPGEHVVELDVWRGAGGRFEGTARYFIKGSSTPLCTARLRERTVDTADAIPSLQLAEEGCGGGVATLVGGGDEGVLSREGGSNPPGMMEQYAVRTGPPVRPAPTQTGSPSRPPAPGAGHPIRLGQTLVGRLEPGDPLAPDQTYYDDYTFSAPDTVRVRIVMRSSDFDAYLMAGTSMEDVARDDDGAGGTDAQVELTVPAGSTLRIRANALSTEMKGGYTLTLQRL